VSPLAAEGLRELLHITMIGIAMSAVLVIARIVFSLLFLLSGVNHFAKLEAMTGYAKYKKLPAAKLGVLLSGVMLVLGSLSIITGYLADLGALLIAIFCVLAAFIFHGFWAESEGASKQSEFINFFKDLSLAGAAVIIFGYIHFIAQLNKAMSPMGATVTDGILKGFGWVISKGHIALWK
jgi:uncharacterized membrane protein YphA (DoxX/SURF4 family)